MKSKVLLLALTLMAGFLSIQPSQAVAAVQVQSSPQSVVLDIQNMTCSMCPITIRKALQGVDGVQKVNVDFDTKTANVTFDPNKTSVDALIKATTNAGYPATIHPEK